MSVKAVLLDHVTQLAVQAQNRQVDKINRQIDALYLSHDVTKGTAEQIQAIYGSVQRSIDANANRRLITNSFYVTVLSSGLAFLGFSAQAFEKTLPLEFKILLVGLFLGILLVCAIWHVSIRSYSSCEIIYYRILIKMEQVHKFPDKVVTVLTQTMQHLGRNYDLSVTEQWLPMIFVLMYFVVMLMGLFQF